MFALVLQSLKTPKFLWFANMFFGDLNVNTTQEEVRELSILVGKKFLGNRVSVWVFPAESNVKFAGQGSRSVRDMSLLARNVELFLRYKMC